MSKLVNKLFAIIFLLLLIGAVAPNAAFAQVRLDGRVLHMNNWPLGMQVPMIIFRWGGTPCAGTDYNAVIQLTGPASGSIGNSKCNAGGPFFTSDDIAPWLPEGFYRVQLTTLPPPGYDYYSVSHAESGTDYYSSVDSFIDVSFTGAFVTHHINFGFNPVPPEPWPVLASTAYSGAPSVPSGINLNWTDRARSESNYIVNRLTTGGAILNSWTLPQNSTSFLVSLAGICNNVPYRYQVYGRNNTVGPYDGWISEATFTCYAAVAAPNPLNFACNATGTQATLSWAAAAGAASYNISTPGIGLSNTAATSLVLNITPGTAYTSTIQSVNTTGFSGPTSTSRSYSCPPPATPPPPTPPPPPAIPLPVTGMTYTCNATRTIANVSWTPSVGATSYDYRVDNQTDAWTGACPLSSATGGDICGNQAGSSMAVGVIPNTPYNMWVHARNASGVSGATNLAINCVLTLPPAAPTNPQVTEFPDPTVTTQLPTGVQFSWTDVSTETGYTVRIYDMNGNQIGATITLPANTTSYLDNSITCGQPNRRYVVEAFNSAGNSTPVEAFGSCRTVGFSTTGTLNVTGSLSAGLRPNIILNGAITLNTVGGAPATAQLVYDIQALQPAAIAGQQVTENRIVKGSQAISNDQIAWPFVKSTTSDPTPTATQVQITARLISSTGTTIATAPAFTLTLPNGAFTPVNPEPTLAPIVNGSKKELSLTPPNFTGGLGAGFNDVVSPPTSLVVGSDYWVRLQIDGTNVPPSVAASSGSDIMLVLDVTGSMSSRIPLGGGSYGSGYTTRIAAAKLALTEFVDDAQSDDRIGLASFVYCIPREQRYINNMVRWGYEGIDNSMGAPVGYSFVHVPVGDATATQKGLLKEYLDTDGDRDLISGGGFCNNKFSGSATDLGGGLSAGLSTLTDLIQGQSRSSGSNYSNSLAGSFSANLPAAYRANIPKYVVIATDGQENQYPMADDAQPLYTQRFGGTRTAVEYAMPSSTTNPERKNVKVYTLTIGSQNDTVKNKLMDISRRTNGVFFLGETQDQLVNSYTKIARQIQQLAPSTEKIEVNEIINDTNFRIQGLDATNFRSNFYISKYVLENGAYVEKDLTTEYCTSFTACIDNPAAADVGKRYNFNLPVFPTNERYNIYFKVQAVAPPAVKGDLVFVDSAASTITDPGGASRSLANKQVLITTPTPFFIANGGDLYSGGKIISSLLIPTEIFTQKPADVIMTKDNSVPLDVANGKISPRDPADRVLYSYPSSSQIEYNLLHTQFESQINPIGLAAGKVNFSPELNTDSIYYEVDSAAATSNRVSIDGLTINNGKPKVLFVDGDVYITNNIQVAKDGLSAFALIASGNIGIAPNVTNIQGVFISEKSIDTVCDRAQGFTSNLCNPVTTAVGNKLTIEGMVYVTPTGKLVLERYGSTSLVNRIPGEEFIYRPDFMMSFINVLGRVGFNWKEIND